MSVRLALRVTVSVRVTLRVTVSVRVMSGSDSEDSVSVRVYRISRGEMLTDTAHHYSTMLLDTSISIISGQGMEYHKLTPL